jgi:LuxR family maltose regulon positive regulatory protein
MVLDVKRGRPPSRDGHLRRSRLVARLRQNSDVPLLAVVAPAGYGKTSLLWEWLAEDPRQGAWLALEDRHNEPALLLEEITHCLNDAPCVIVLDDAHVLCAPAALQAVGSLAEHLPAGSQLALASRTAAPLSLGRLRAHRAVLELRSEDLALTAAEAAELLERAGLRLSSDELEVLMERTEGWAAGLYLAALSLREEPQVGVALERFTGSDRVVSDYMWEEFLLELPPEAVDFLTRSSILDELHGPLCDAVLDRNESARMLDRLARSTNLLLVALDRSGRRYRCHRLLRDVLLEELRRSDPLAELELHRRASAWYAAKGEPDRAIDHAVQAGDAGCSGDLIWANLLRYIPHGRNALVRGWLDAFSSTQLSAHAPLALAAAHSHLADGDIRLAEHWALVAAGMLGRGSDCAHAQERALSERQQSERELSAGVVLVEAAAARHGVHAMSRDAAHAYELEPQESPWRALGCLLRGVGQHLRGDREQARAHLEEGVQRSSVEAPLLEALCLTQLAMLLLEEEEELEGAMALIDRAILRIDRHGLDGYPTVALSFAVSAAIRAHAGRVEEAQRDLHRAERLTDLLEDFAPWYEAQTRIALARARLALSDVRQTRTLLAEASRHARRVPDAVVLRSWLQEIWEQVDTAAVLALPGSAALTMAELRILRFLPTHLSFREIGMRLHVSTNTVKTQAHAVYRKLDVSSRSQAVTRAGEIGLLDAQALTAGGKPHGSSARRSAMRKTQSSL